MDIIELLSNDHTEVDQLFDRFDKTDDPSEQDEIARQVVHDQGLVPTHPHPLVPGTATAQLAAGPWATAIDKVRDLLGAGPR